MSVWTVAGIHVAANSTILGCSTAVHKLCFHIGTKKTEHLLTVYVPVGQPYCAEVPVCHFCFHLLLFPPKPVPGQTTIIPGPKTKPATPYLGQKRCPALGEHRASSYFKSTRNPGCQRPRAVRCFCPWLYCCARFAATE